MFKNRSKLIKTIIILLVVVGVLELGYFVIFQKLGNLSLGQKLDLPNLQQQTANLFGDKPVCGDVKEMIVLAVGIDYRDGDYLYGLSDVIRVVRIDFTKPQVNVVAIPRNVLVQPPARLPVESPILLNQSYFYGSPGMDKFEGQGYGAGALAETIYYSFNLRSDQYVVMDFKAFAKFIDALGGVEIDLPTEVSDGSAAGYFPAGKQTLNGERALILARIRNNYSDLVRISNQSIILKGIYEKLKDPAILVNLPQMYTTLKDSFVTDLSANQISAFICLVDKVKNEDIQFFNPPEDLLVYDTQYIPNLNADMIIYRWDQNYVNWLQNSVYANRQ